MEFGAVFLPQIGWGPDNPFTLDVLEGYVRTARALGFSAITANDHIVYKGPWIDGPTLLAASLPFADGSQHHTTLNQRNEVVVTSRTASAKEIGSATAKTADDFLTFAHRLLGRTIRSVRSPERRRWL